MANKNKYFASLESRECASVLEDKIQNWRNAHLTSGIINKIQKSYAYYHGNFDMDGDMGSGHSIRAGGDQGELQKITVNHYRNIASHLLNLTMANRPALKARAVNTDTKSLSQAILADGLLDYYMREKNLEDVLKQAAEYAIVLTEGYIKLGWDVTSGEIIAFDEETQTSIHNGDLTYQALSALDVIRDVYRTDNTKNDWYITKTYRNKYDLAAKYEDKTDNILNSRLNDTENMFKLGTYKLEETDLVPVYEFFHDRTDSVKGGRYMLFLDAETVLLDTPLPYREMPIYRMVASNYLGTAFGYTSLFDLIPLQENINMLYSVILSNQNAFGVQNVLVPQGADINFTSLAGGLNLIEYPPGFEPPRALNLTATPAEIFNHVKYLEGLMETLSGINSVTRGNPEASLRTGAALALVQAQAIQFTSTLQMSFVKMLENVGTQTIKLLQQFAQTPRVAAIVGQSNRTYLKEFKAGDLQSINRVVADVTNPLSKTAAGRMEMAGELLQYGQGKMTPAQYLSVVTTGNLEVLTDSTQDELLFIRSENERLADGKSVRALVLDDHTLHINEHKSVLYDSDVRNDQELASAVLDHITEHIMFLKETDPAVLAIIGQQSLAPPPQAGMEQMGQDMGEIAAAPPVGAQAAQEIALPSMPRAAGNPDMPISPEEGLAEITG